MCKRWWSVQKIDKIVASTDERRSSAVEGEHMRGLGHWWGGGGAGLCIPHFDGVLHAEQSKTSAWDLVSIAVVCADHG